MAVWPDLRFPPPPPPPDRPELPEGVEPTPVRDGLPPWRPWTSWVALLAAFAATLFAALVIGVVAAASGSSISNPTPAVNIASTVAQDFCLIGAAVLFARMAALPRPWQFGLRPTRLWPAIGWMLVAWGAFFVVTLVWVAVFNLNSTEKLPDELGTNDSTTAMIAVAFLVAVIAPAAEEFFFRGYFFTALRNWKGLWPAAVITGVVFGAIHAGSANAGYLVPLGFFGFALCLLYARTRSLYPGIATHCLNNCVAFGSAEHWGWQIPVLMVCALGVLSAVALAVRRTWPPSGAAASYA
ncbi:MAG TPA: CPBP family intramembrane glutamic endopeptidase [Solirubrobacteraceae bacterium]|nr:CPBP family intramembrane glutamic endopeptidase [Solirubrobacteraceae bacterium]